jgi:hypothetical protein
MGFAPDTVDRLFGGRPPGPVVGGWLHAAEADGMGGVAVPRHPTVFGWTVLDDGQRVLGAVETRRTS